VQLIPTCIIAYYAYQQWNVSEKNRRTQQFQRYIENHQNLIEAFSKILHGDTKEQELGFKQLREVRDEAQLCLSKEVIDFINLVGKKAHDINILRANGLAVSSKEEATLKNELMREVSDAWEVYRKSLFIDS
jgi:hypothetical protein